MRSVMPVSRLTVSALPASDIVNRLQWDDVMVSWNRAARRAGKAWGTMSLADREHATRLQILADHNLVGILAGNGHAHAGV